MPENRIDTSTGDNGEPFPRLPHRNRLERHAVPYLAALLGCSTDDAWIKPVTWQVFDDTPAKDESKARILHGRLDELASELDGMNTDGCGIFVAVNETNLKGRTKENIIASRAAWADLDEKDASQPFTPEALPLQPGIVVRSGHGHHLYFLHPHPLPLDNGRKAEAEALLRGIQDVLTPYGADPKVCQVASVLRVPGFYNMKRDPLLVELVSVSDARYTPADLARTFPPVGKPSRKKKGAALYEPALAFLRKLDMAVGAKVPLPDGDGWRTSCPWHGEHTDAADDPSCGFVTLWPDGRLRHWECKHRHCEGRGVDDLVTLARERGIAIPDGLTGLPEIVVEPPEHRVAEAARAALAATGTIFQRGGQLVAIRRAPAPQEGASRIVPAGMAEIGACAPAYIRERMSASARFVSWHKGRGDDEPKLKPSLVPQWLPFTLTDGMEHPGFPELTAVVETPVFLPDGRILDTPGMDAESGLFFEPLHNFPPVPERPSRDDARAAINRLIEIVRDFEFASQPSPEAHRTAWLGLLLTVVGRYAIPGPVPMGVIDASVAGSGKGLLTRITAIIATGRDVPVMSTPRSPEELSKSLLPVLLAGTRMQLLDEASAFGGGPELNAVTTAPMMTQRILGTSRVATMANLTVFVLNGNNLSLQDETPRRSLPIRLEPSVEKPEERDGWTYPDLVGHVQAHQPELLRDALTILRAFHVAGRPASGLAPWGSFEAWSRLVRDAVHWATDGMDLDCRPSMATGSDLTRQALRGLVDGIRGLYGDHAFAADALARVANLPLEHPEGHHALAEALHTLAENREGQVTGKTVGRALLRHRRRVVGGFVIDKDERESRNGALWRLIPATTEGGGTWQNIA